MPLSIPSLGSQGLINKGVLGPEKLVNGDFGAGATGWTVTGNDATHIATFSGGTLRYQSDTTSPVLVVAQSVAPATTGRTYLVTVVCTAFVGAGSVKVFDQGGTNNVTVTGVGTFTNTVVATSNGFSITRGAANVDVTLDSVSLREVPTTVA